ncbi:MAG: hypothetical protein JXD23_10015, partial [Spirochaetales bacterium]|nr:hypothetical protein [Spirochaetales bacterium]
MLRIEPGDGKNNALAVVYKYKKTEKNYAVFRRFSLVNTDAPVYAFISDDGIIFTFDDWYHMGHDHALIKYDIDG